MVARQKPTKSFILPYRKSKGEQAVKLYAMTGRSAQKWQALLLKDMMAQTAQGLWVHSTFGYTVPRRNGKTEDVYMREIYGLLKGEQILHTAHLVQTAHASYEATKKLIINILGKEYIAHDFKTRGMEHIMLATGGKIEYRTRTNTGALGEGFDLLVIDEAQEFTNDQATALKYVISASKNPQKILLGTPPTSVSAGTEFVNLRKRVFAGETADTGWAEWGIEKPVDIHDRKYWYQTNPSLGTLLTERAVLAEIGDDETDFMIQRLGMWYENNLKSAISEAEWAELAVKKAKPIGRLHVGIKYGIDGTNVAMSVAAKTKDKIFVSAIDCRPTREGNDWIVNFLKNAEIDDVVADGTSAQLLQDKLDEEKAGVELIRPTVREYCMAGAVFEQALESKTIEHEAQPSVDEVTAHCAKRLIGKQGGWGYKSLDEEHEIALLDSIVLAHWLCLNEKPKKAMKVWY